MKNQIRIASSSLQPLTHDTAKEIAQWEYEAPYESYSFKGMPNGYLMDESVWGTEQFCLLDGAVLLGQVSCQYEGDDLWVGWSLAPQLCGKGYGAAFVERCVKELRRVKVHTGRVLLRVSARNQRAINAYQKAGFRYVETIQDEIAYSGQVEDFWVMALSSTIGVREAITESDVAAFWEQLHAYHIRDIFPDLEDEDRAYFLNDSEYRAHIELLHARETDRIRYLFFCRDGADIGFALTVIYGSEDGKCFLLEFCVFPEHRGNGTGRECAEAFLCWARGEGAKYAELNFSTEQRRRFWSRVGFVFNGCDEWGEPLMLLPPEEDITFTVEKLTDGGDWQLHKLLNGFLAEIGEETLSDEKKERIARAAEDSEIQLFAAKRGCRSVGLCSVSRYWSTFSCGEVGVFDDFYIEPAFRKKGAARLLATAAQEWCREQGLASISVTCAPCDEGMYKSLGFDELLGGTLVHLI